MHRSPVGYLDLSSLGFARPGVLRTERGERLAFVNGSIFRPHYLV
ncbi:MAG: hypothetical protein WBG02_06345 [Candidatus Acidiferrum sp.]